MRSLNSYTKAEIDLLASIIARSNKEESRPKEISIVIDAAAYGLLSLLQLDVAIEALSSDPTPENVIGVKTIQKFKENMDGAAKLFARVTES